MYDGHLISGLVSLVEQVYHREKLFCYLLQDSSGNVYGRFREMFPSEADTMNHFLSECGSDYRWSLIPERGSR